MIRPAREAGSAHLALGMVIAALLIGVIGFLFWQNVLNKPAASEVVSYAECVKSQESKILESYPERCVTKVGKSFTNPDQKAAKPQAISTKKFCAPLEKLCFEHPTSWTVTSEAVNQQDNGISERFVVADESGKPWLRLETGLSGVGGSCGNEDGSYAKILKTHTSGIAGSYLVNAGSEQFSDPAAYAVGMITYNGTSKKWTMSMNLNTSKATHAIAKIDVCEVGLAVLNGKNAKFDPSVDSVGAVTFGYYHGSKDDPTYATEAEAAAALSSAGATKAYDILQSARYQ